MLGGYPGSSKIEGLLLDLPQQEAVASSWLRAHSPYTWSWGMGAGVIGQLVSWCHQRLSLWGVSKASRAHFSRQRLVLLVDCEDYIHQQTSLQNPQLSNRGRKLFKLDWFTHASPCWRSQIVSCTTSESTIMAHYWRSQTHYPPLLTTIEAYELFIEHYQPLLNHQKPLSTYYWTDQMLWTCIWSSLAYHLLP